MKKMKMLVLGLAAAGVLLAGVAKKDAVARAISGLYGESLRIADTGGRAGSPLNTLGTGDAYIQGDLEVGGQNYVVVPATQTLAAAFTIAADACGGLKRVLAASDVTSDTTNTIAAPSAANKGCRMMIVNVSATQTIYLDNNALFPLTNVASMAIGPKGSVQVFSDGSFWLHTYWTEY